VRQPLRFSPARHPLAQSSRFFSGSGCRCAAADRMRRGAACELFEHGQRGSQFHFAVVGGVAAAAPKLQHRAIVKAQAIAPSHRVPVLPPAGAIGGAAPPVLIKAATGDFGTNQRSYWSLVTPPVGSAT